MKKICISIILLFVLGLGACTRTEEQWARLYQIENRSALVGGNKAMGQVGDFKLENDRVRMVINGHGVAHTGGGVNRWGGTIMDADIQRPSDLAHPESHGHDNFLQLMPMFHISTFAVESDESSTLPTKVADDAFTILNDGSNGLAAELRVSGTTKELIPLMQVLAKPIEIRGETVYSLAPGKNYVKVTTTFYVPTSGGGRPEVLRELPVRPLNRQDNPIHLAANGNMLGDALFYGHGLNPIGPGVFGFSAAVHTQEKFARGETHISHPLYLEWTGAASKFIGYGLVSPGGPIAFPIMESFLTVAVQQIHEDGASLQAAGDALTYVRYFVIDDGDINGVLDHVIDLKGWISGRVAGRVVAEADGTPAHGARVVAFRHPRLKDGTYVPLQESYGAMNEYLASLAEGQADATRLVPYTRFSVDARERDHLPDASFEGSLPITEGTEARYLFLALGEGNSLSRLIPVRVRKGDTAPVRLTLPTLGSLDVEVFTDGLKGPREGAKITVIGQKGEGRPDPVIGQGFMPSGIAAIEHTFDGRARLKLPAGSYRVIATRGYAYTAGEQVVTVGAGQTQNVRLGIRRVIDTSGWVASDLHMHGMRSPDSNESDHARILAALSEGIEVAVATDHDVIAKWQPSLEALDGRTLLRLFPGVEISQFSYGHFNAFPLRHDPEAVGGGAPLWRNPSPTADFNEYTPQDLFDAARAQGDQSRTRQSPFIMVNHSQEMITGYFRAYGFWQYENTFRSPDVLTYFNKVVHGGIVPRDDTSANFSWDFDGMEVLNSSRPRDFRTIPAKKVAEAGQKPKAYLPTMTRTAAEQRGITSGSIELHRSYRGMLDDYMTILIRGKKLAAVGVSDSHSKLEESGKFRTYVALSNADPAYLDEDEYITNLKDGRVIAMGGPFLEMWVEGRPIGSELTVTNGQVKMRIRAQAVPWVSLDRIEIYGNGVLVGEIGAAAEAAGDLPCETSGIEILRAPIVERLDQTFVCAIERDTAYVAIAVGYEGMSPYILPNEGPGRLTSNSLLVGLNELLEAWMGLSDVLPTHLPIEPEHPTYPQSVANAIWVDTDGVDLKGDGRLYDGPARIPGTFNQSSRGSGIPGLAP